MQNRFLTSHLTIFFTFLLVTLISPIALESIEVPELKKRLTDQTWTLSQDFQNQWEAKLRNFEIETSNQIAVLVIPSLENENLEDFSLKVAEQAKLGQKGKDNGVLLLISLEDREVRIEVGYGLEGALPDVVCKRIIDTKIKPNFRERNYEQGVTEALETIILATKGEFTYTPKDYSYLGPFEFVGDLDSEDKLPILLRIGLSGFILLVLSPFTYFAMFASYIGWFVYFFLFPFWLLFPVAIHGANMGVFIFLCYAIPVFIWKVFALITPWGRKIMKKRGIAVSNSGSSGKNRSGGFSSGRSSGGGFRGGGGSFGGGGSSGSW